MTNIAVLGLGRMGAPIAGRLAGRPRTFAGVPGDDLGTIIGKG